jgi:hypothetical protein
VVEWVVAALLDQLHLNKEQQAAQVEVVLVVLVLAD